MSDKTVPFLITGDSIRFASIEDMIAFSNGHMSREEVDHNYQEMIERTKDEPRVSIKVTKVTVDKDKGAVTFDALPPATVFQRCNFCGEMHEQDNPPLITMAGDIPLKVCPNMPQGMVFGCDKNAFQKTFDDFRERWGDDTACNIMSLIIEERLKR